MGASNRQRQSAPGDALRRGGASRAARPTPAGAPLAGCAWAGVSCFLGLYVLVLVSRPASSVHPIEPRVSGEYVAVTGGWVNTEPNCRNGVRRACVSPLHGAPASAPPGDSRTSQYTNTPLAFHSTFRTPQLADRDTTTLYLLLRDEGERGGRWRRRGRRCLLPTREGSRAFASRVQQPAALPTLRGVIARGDRKDWALCLPISPWS